MNLLLEIVINNGLLVDAAGLIGLGLVALAAAKLSLRYRSWGGMMMAIGAIAVLIGRLYLMIAPQFITMDLLCAAGPIGLGLMDALPPLLVTMGLAGIVWGLWGHERWLNELNR